MKMVHQDGDFKVTLEGNDQGQLQVMATDGDRLIWEQRYTNIVPAVARYLQGIADESGCYGSNRDEAVQIEALVNNRVAR